MYAAPVVWPVSLLSEKYGPTVALWYGLYPMAGVIEGFRSALIGSQPMPWSLIIMGFISSIILIFLLFLIIKTMFFSLTFISPNDLVNFSNLCENGDFSSSINKKCENIILIYWLLLASFFFSLLSIITLYPFFKMNKPKKN